VIEYLQQLNYWHWWVFGVAMFILEMLGVGGFLIGIGTAALVLGLLVVIGLVSSWQMQLLTFSTLAVVFTMLYWKYFRSATGTDPASTLNQRGLAYVGRHFTASAPVVGGFARLQFGDTFWEVNCDQDIAEGEQFLVESVEGMTLKIRKES
jgi:inner membrane protein